MKLTGRQESAAVLLAEDHLTDEEIAQKIGITRRTLAKWKVLPVFSARVHEIGADLASRARNRGIARRERRLATLQALHNRLLKVIEERAADPELAKIPGGKTGLIVRKPIASGGELVGFEYAVDTGTLKELRAISEQAAKELGQLIDRHEHRLIRRIEDLSDEELAALAGTPAEASGSAAPEDEM